MIIEKSGIRFDVIKILFQMSLSKETKSVDYKGICSVKDFVLGVGV